MRSTTLKRWRTPAGYTWCPPLPGLGAPTGTCTPGAPLWASPGGTKREHIIRARQESIAYQVADLVEAMEKDTGLPLRQLKADGGALRDNFLMQFQADILARQVLRPAVREATALGAAYLAGLATGVWQNTGELKQLWRGVSAPSSPRSRPSGGRNCWPAGAGRWSAAWAGPSDQRRKAAHILPCEGALASAI